MMKKSHSKMKGYLKQVLRTLNGIEVTIVIDKEQEPEFAEGTYYTIKPYKEKRSLNANAYYWKLCGKLSHELNIPPIEIYREHIKGIGGNYEVLPLKDEAVDKFREVWELNGMGYVTQVIGKAKLEGYTNIMAYYGSSTYNSKQMSQLIDLMVTDCKEQGIETLTPKELEKLKGLEP